MKWCSVNYRSGQKVFSRSLVIVQPVFHLFLLEIVLSVIKSHFNPNRKEAFEFDAGKRDTNPNEAFLYINNMKYLAEMGG